MLTRPKTSNIYIRTFILIAFLFEVQLLCLSLHIGILLFEDSAWSRGRWKMEKLEHFRHVFLFQFNRGAKDAETARNICAVYEENAIGDRTARKWFYLLKKDRFDISDTPHSGRPSSLLKIV